MNKFHREKGGWTSAGMDAERHPGLRTANIRGGGGGAVAYLKIFKKLFISMLF
jgi:hypothetical protein